MKKKRGYIGSSKERERERGGGDILHKFKEMYTVNVLLSAVSLLALNICIHLTTLIYCLVFLQLDLFIHFFLSCIVILKNMAVIHLNPTEEALFIILTVLLSIIIISLIIILYKKRSYFTQQRDQHVWHDFIMIDSPDHMIALKNSESLSFDSRRRRSSTPMLYHGNNKPLLTSQNKSMSTISITVDDDLITKYNNTTSTTLLPKSPPPVYHNQ